MDLGYLSTAKEDKFDAAIVEFLAEEMNRVGRKEED